MRARNPSPTDGPSAIGRSARRRAAALWLGAFALGLILLSTVGLPLLYDDDGLARSEHDVLARGGQNVRAQASDKSSPARGHRRHDRTGPLPNAVVTIGPRAAIRPVPRSFFGLSTEYWAIPLYERRAALFERALSLLQARGNGPAIMRIGGDSADHTFWVPGRRKMPWWAFSLTPAWVRKVSGLVRHEQLRLLLDLNLVTDKARIAAQWARAAEAGLPRGSIIGFEVGNEPDLYAHWFWLASIGRTRLAADILPRALSADSYARDFGSYSRALAAVAPSVPLIGPALANPQLHASWLTRLVSGPHPGLGVLSAHRYPYSACVGRRAADYPTIARVLSEHASAGIAQTVRGAVRYAHHAGLQFRVTELNSVTCGGLTGISNTFATALWAPDTLFELLRAGVDGVNLHIRANTVNAPFSLSGDGLRARPLMYGLVMFIRTLGRDPYLVRSHVHAQRSLHVKAWAVRQQGRVLHVLVIDKGKRSVRVELRLPARGRATVMRLRAPSARATSGVTLGGRHLSSNGSWEGARVGQTLRRTAHGYVLTMPRMSEALVGVRLAPGALSGRRSRPRGGRR